MGASSAKKNKNDGAGRRALEVDVDVRDDARDARRGEVRDRGALGREALALRVRAVALGRERAELLGERVARRRLRRVGEAAELPAEHLGLDPRVARDVLEQVRRLRAAAARARLPELAERRRAHARPLGPGRAVVREVGDAERRPEHVPEAVGPRELVRRGLERRDAAVHELRAAVRVGRLEPEVANLGCAAGHAAGDDGEERRRRVERRREEPRLGRTREIQRRFNVSVPRARVPKKASTLRDRSER